MRKEHSIRINTEKCIGCGRCEKDCPANNILIEAQKARIITRNCILCGHCVAICPKAAVSMTGFDEQPEEIEKPAVLDSGLLLQALHTRRSIRQFTEEQIAPEVIAQVIEAGRLTPTGGNTQDVSFLLLKEEISSFEEVAVRLFRRLLPFIKLVNPAAKRMEVDEHFFFKKAPAAIVVASQNKVNGALDAANMALMAEACGLGVLYSGFFSMAINRSRTLKRSLGLKHGEKAVTTLVLGYAGIHYYRTVQKEAAYVRRF